MVNVLNIVAKEHKKWLRIARSFGLQETAEDLVQDMYLKIHDWKGKYDKTLMFNKTEVNHYFVFLVLRNLFLDLCRANKKKAAKGYSMLELSKQTGIDYYSIYRTKNKIQKLLNQKLEK